MTNESQKTNLHPRIEALADLLGTYQGQGKGYYPTIEDFEYSETTTFGTAPGKPFFRYEQKTASPAGQPMHQELGYLRVVSDVEDGQADVEFVLSQPTGQTELLNGTIKKTDDGKIEITLEESTLVNAPTAKTVDKTMRYLTLTDDGTLDTAFHMEAVGEPMAQHLESTLKRV